MKFMPMAIALTLLCGCATLKDAGKARGTGVKQKYEHPYDLVWAKVVGVINESTLDLVSKDKKEGKILAQKGMSAFSYGENVAVFIERDDKSSSIVEVVSKRALATNITARNWASYIHEKLKESLN